MNYTIVSENQKTRIRENFIENFINTEHEHYKKHIATLQEYIDGMCYDGYLWDTLKDPYDQTECKQEKVIEFLRNKENVFVMWDIHSNQQIIMDDIIRLNNPKDTIISTNTDELCKLIEYEWNNWDLKSRYLPEDIYIFDDSMKWCAIFTHEADDNFTNPALSDDDYVRICFVIVHTL